MPLRMQCPTRRRWQQSHRFYRLSQPIERYDELNNDVESRGAGYADIVLAANTKVVFSAPVIIGHVPIILCEHTSYAIIKLIY